MINKTLKRIRRHIRQDFEKEKTGHDIKHLDTVTAFAKKILKKEGGDAYVILIAALLHDIHRLLSISTELKLPVSPKESLEKVEEILKNCGVLDAKIPQILDVVEKHDEKDGKITLELETKIVQDADVLAALGKEGLRRTLAFCKYKNIPVANNSFPLDAPEYVPEVKPISTCHYFYRTQIPLKDMLHTKTAKKLAKNKVNVLKKFINKNYKQKVC